MALQHLRSSTANKRPDPTVMAEGQLALNTANASPGLFYKDATGSLIKSGPVHIGATAPNATPAAGGHAGNSVGEAWLDTSGTNPLLKIWNGSAFVTVQPVASGTVVSTADTGTVTSTMILDGTILNADINASAAIVDTKLATIATGGKVSGTAITSGNISTSGSFTSTSTVTGTNLIPTGSGVPTNGIYLPAANSVAVATNGTGRLFVDASGLVGIGTSSPGPRFHVVSADTTTPGFFQLSDATTTLGNSFNTIHRTGTDGDNRYSLSAWQVQNTSSLTQRAFIGARAVTGAANYNPLMVFGTTTGNGTYDTRMVIDGSGRVGIGTSAPQAKFEVAGDAVIGTDNTGLVQFTSLGVPFFAVAADVSNYRSTRINVVSAGGWADLSFDAIDVAPKTGLPSAGSLSGSIMYLDASAQRVGIGDTGPDALLTVNGVVSHGAGSASAPSIAARGDLNTGIFFPAADTIAFAEGGAEAARIDSSGRLLVGTSTARSNINNVWGASTPRTQIESNVNDGNLGLSLINNSTGGYSPVITLGLSLGSSIGSNTLVSSAFALGTINFTGSDGTNFIRAASISALVDGTSSTNDMPGRIQFATTADGSASPTERLRITSDGVQAYNQPAPAAVNATATLTVADLKAGIITSTSAAATDMTLPTGTDTQAGFSGTYDNFTFEWSVINTGPSLVRVLAATAHTIVGSGSVATGTSGQFASRRTASNTFVTYRLS